MNKFVKFARGTVGVIQSGATGSASGFASGVTFHNGIKPVHRSIENRALTEITAAEFELAVRKKGQTSMLQYLVTTEIEAVVWHTDPKDLPTVGMYCLVFTKGGSGVEGRATFTGQNWRMHDGYRHTKDFIRAWAYEPKGPK